MVLELDNFHLFHYMSGYLFYAGVNLLQFSILFRNYDVQSGKMNFLRNGYVKFLSFLYLLTGSIGYLNLTLGSLLYLFGSISQHISLKQFASLRHKSKKTDSKNADLNHYLPHGFLFEFVSCPHYLSELLIYLAISLTLNLYINAFILFIFVFVIHLPMALQSHDWYLRKFKETYPKNRKALIPFIF